MKIISIIDHHQKDVVKKILKHCKLWHDNDPPSDIAQTLALSEEEFVEEVTVDHDFFKMIV